MSEPVAPIPMVPVSWGEVIDKVTILEIKLVRLSDGAARANVSRELEQLRGLAAPALARVATLAAELKTLNETLWDVEDRIRDHERSQNFDSEFVALARSVYRTNDARGRVKREISQTLGSGLVEEKSYRPY
jgi:hypothetical protein